MFQHALPRVACTTQHGTRKTWARRFQGLNAGKRSAAEAAVRQRILPSPAAKTTLGADRVSTNWIHYLRQRNFNVLGVIYSVANMWNAKRRFALPLTILPLSVLQLRQPLGSSSGTGWTTKLSPGETASLRREPFCKKNGMMTPEYPTPRLMVANPVTLLPEQGSRRVSGPGQRRSPARNDVRL